MKRITTYLMIAIAAMSLASCLSSNEMASEYLEKFPGDKDFPQVKIYVCLPTEVIHTNQTLNQIDNFLYLSPSVQDSIIIANTKFLNRIDDKVFLQQFTDNLLYHLRRTGAQVEAVADRNAIPQTGENCFVLNIPQIEAEEFIKKSRSEFVEKNGTYYHYDYVLNGYSTNVWYLFGNDTNAVYYKNFEIMDKFKGQVEEVKNKKASVTGKFRRININDVYEDVAFAGKRTAILFVEKIVSEYLASKGRDNTYYIYNPIYNGLGVDALSAQAVKNRTFQKIDNK